MSEVQEETSVETGGREVLVRTFAVAEQSVDGRTLHVRVVPFGETATVADPPDFRPYEEEFVPGVFDRQMNAANRIRLRTDHAGIDNSGARRPGLAGVVGNGLNIRETNGGVDMEFLFMNTPEADTALELVKNDAYDGVSAEFAPKVNKRTRSGVIQRVKAHLDSVALAVGPAYGGATILGLREEEDDGVVTTIDEELMPPPINLELLERCIDLGIELPEDQAILLARAFTEIPWDGSASRWDTAEAYCSAAAIDLNPSGAAKIKGRCHLPFKEPGGAINVGGVRAALSRIGQGYPEDATQPQRDAAKARLEKILSSFNSTSPQG